MISLRRWWCASGPIVAKIGDAPFGGGDCGDQSPAVIGSQGHLVFAIGVGPDPVTVIVPIFSGSIRRIGPFDYPIDPIIAITDAQVF